MAWSWLTVAAKTIPWATLIRRAPEIIEVSTRLLGNRKANQAARHAASRPQSEVDELLQRLKNLETHDQENAKVVEQIAEQMRDLTNSVEVLAARVRVLLVVVAATAAAVVVGILAALL
ncbi:MAG TPA: hypothetical protein VK138_04395 [Acidiferrobacterales bacterium]|nr:hypothetical protein [Acidiferrobacterales bacterium]